MLLQGIVFLDEILIPSWRSRAYTMSTFNPDQLDYVNPNSERRVCLITGGNSGIGFYTVLHLYLHGYTVYLAGRNKLRVTTAISAIEKEALERRSKYSTAQLNARHLGSLHHLSLDLLSLDSVEAATKEFKQLEKALHLLILNAGIMAVPYEKTKDGFEIQLQTSYVSHFLLTDRLIDLMTSEESDQQVRNGVLGDPASVKNRTGSIIRDPRIIFLSSIGHWFAFFPFKLDWQYNYWPNMIFTLFRYGMAKCAGIQFMKSLAIRHPSVLSVSVHPGIVLNTNLFTHLTTLPLIGTIYWILFKLFELVIGISNEEGSYSSVYCALSSNVNRDKDNGKFYTTFGVESNPSYIANNPSLIDKSWAWTVHQLDSRGHKIDSL